MGPGAPWLAQVSGAALLPLSVEFASYWRLGRWDGFLIPKPFAKVDVTLRALHEVPPTADEATLDVERERLQTLMMEQTGVR
jgi:lysophospholipid acyltransferase (LPLAT)-like uncharacterized protein